MQNQKNHIWSIHAQSLCREGLWAATNTFYLNICKWVVAAFGLAGVDQLWRPSLIDLTWTVYGRWRPIVITWKFQ